MRLDEAMDLASSGLTVCDEPISNLQRFSFLRYETYARRLLAREVVGKDVSSSPEVSATGALLFKP